MKKALFAAFVALIINIGLAVGAAASTISFTIYDDPDFHLNGQTHLGGSVTGLLFGLEDNVSGQVPTAIQFTSNVDAFGMDGTFYNTFTRVAGGLKVEDGQVVFVGLVFDFEDLFGDTFRLSFNSASINQLRTLGGGELNVGIGNADGFTGTTYSHLSAVPIPAAAWLFISGLAGLFGFKRFKAA